MQKKKIEWGWCTDNSGWGSCDNGNVGDDCECVCVFVCVGEWEREKERESEWVRER